MDVVTLALAKKYTDSVAGGGVNYIQIPDATTITQELVPNVLYKFLTLTTCTSLTVALPSGANWYDEFVLYFTTSTTPPTITLPMGITWVGGTPTFSANKTYIIRIQNGIGAVSSV